MRFEDISYNFSIAKVLAILIVATSHFFEGLWWIPTSNALFVFAFSSGFFTAKKYSYGFSKKKFWSAKISRLMYPIIVIDVFLLFLFVAKQVDGIFTWHTIPSLLGLNGFLKWLGIVNSSPFGAGLWFFSVLILFYVLYPFFSFINKNQIHAITFLFLSLVATTFLHYRLHMGYMLWLTVFAFIFGAYAGKYNFKISAIFLIFFIVVSYILMIFLNITYDFNRLNYFFILINSIAIVGYLINKKLPILFFENVLLLSGCIIEIYFIHTYLFFRPTENIFIDYLISIIGIVAVSYLLSNMSEKLRIVINRNI